MRSIRPGRGPSALSGISGIFGIIFGIFWTILAFSLTRNSPFPLVGTIFPLFGIGIIIMGVIGVVYNFRNASSKDRLSLLDITSPSEESDPLNDLFGRKAGNSSDDVSVESKLNELDALRQKGLITDSEHSTQRQRILDQI